MEIKPEELSILARYKILTGCIVPRFIAFISTLSVEGVANIAPFSYSTIASHDPMSLLFCVAGPKPDGSLKDTLRNSRFSADGGAGEFVVNLASESYLQAMAASAAPLSNKDSEFAFTGLAQAKSVGVKPPRLACSLAAFECITTHVIAVGTARLIVGEIKHIFLNDRIVDDKFHIDPHLLGAVGRMAGSTYTKTTDLVKVVDEQFFPKY